MKKILFSIVFIILSALSANAQFFKLRNFSGVASGAYGRSTLFLQSNVLYGTTYGGGTVAGTLFKVNPDGTGFTKLKDFTGTNGLYPLGGLISDGIFLYGVTAEGGTTGKGTIYKIMPDGTGFLKLLDFTGAANGEFPGGALYYDGTYLYGTTSQGGTSDMGVIYKIKTDGTGFVKLFDCTLSNGRGPVGGLISDGTFLYGTTFNGGASNLGVLYKIQTDGTGFIKIFDFTGAVNGGWPNSPPIFNAGVIVGMTTRGGANDLGTIYSIQSDGTGYIKSFDFAGADGISPMNSLISDGTYLYGMTQDGGVDSMGTIFKIMPDGSGFSSLHSLSYSDGTSPFCGLVLDGTFAYGITSNGGSSNYGTVFRYNYVCSTVNISQSPVICFGQSISVNGNLYSVNGTYIDTLSAYLGCDSIVTTNLTVLPSYLINQSPTICQGQSVAIGSNIYSISGIYHDTLSTYMGCDSIIITNLSVTPLPLLIISNPAPVCSPTTVDISMPAVTAGSSPGSFSYWADAAGSVGLSSTFYTAVDSSGTYYIQLTSSGCSSILPVSVSFASDCVWPGDANNDFLVDNFDLLPLGIFYLQTGPPRTTTSNSFQAFPSGAWGLLQPSGADIKHADCNGDGTIDNNDTLAVNLNFALTHAFAPTNNEMRLSGPDLHFVTSSSSYLSGSIVDLEVWAGHVATPVTNLYGLAFDINYDASLVQPSSESLTYPASWLATPGTDAITIAKVDALANTAYGAETRINHTNASGFGKIADFKFQLKTSIPANTAMYFSVTGYAANDATGLPVLFNTPLDSIIINPTSVAVNEINNVTQISIYPNPTNGSFNVFTSQQIKNGSVEIYNNIGELVFSQKIINQQNTIDLKNQASGLYFVKVISDGEVIGMKKVVKE